MKKISKSDSERQIKEFFEDIENKSPKEIEKMKKIAMSHNIQLKELRKKFCKKCFKTYQNPGIRIKNDIISLTCETCGYKSRWKIK